MTDLRELYQEVILDHGRKPRNCRALDGANRLADGANPLCGDEIRVFVNLEGDLIKDISFQGRGCAISTASASMMTAALKGKTKAQADAMFERFHQMVTGRDADAVHAQSLGKLAVFSGVCEFPVRVKCATLPWHTAHAALAGSKEPVTTE